MKVKKTVKKKAKKGGPIPRLQQKKAAKGARIPRIQRKSRKDKNKKKTKR